MLCATTLSALGLDPGLGLGLHTDTADRASLVFDILEPVRPQVETWLLDRVASEPLRRGDFFETATGNCRLMSQICTKLSETVSVWGKLVAPWAEYVAQTLFKEAKSDRSRASNFPTRLTQQRRTEAKGGVWISPVEPPKADHLCRGCGKRIMPGSTHCAKCAVGSATERLIDAARSGRIADWSLPLVRRPDSARLPSPCTTLADPGGTSWNFTRKRNGWEGYRSIANAKSGLVF